MDWQDGDLRFERFEDYWDGDKPYFDVIEYLPGGDSESLARRVLVTGDADWADWLASVDPTILQEMAASGARGQIVQIPTNSIETLYLNFADPNTEIEGARAEPGTSHPLFSDHRVRGATAYALDREAIAGAWGSGAEPCRQLLAGPAAFQGSEFPSSNLDRARALLAEAGVTGGDLLYQTSVNAERQAVQQVVASRLEALGFSVEQKAIDAGNFFSSQNEPPETYGHFYADLQMFTSSSGPYPLEWARRFRSDEVAGQDNFWSGENFTRYANPSYDALWDQAAREMDPARQAELWREMTTLLAEDVAAIPLIRRNQVAAVSARVGGWSFSPWAQNPTWNLKNWIPVGES